MGANMKGPALKALRVSAGMTLQQVSDSAGVSLARLSRVENGRANPTDGWVTLVAVAIGEHLASSDDAA